MNILLSILFTTAMAATCPKTELIGFEGGMNEDDKAAFNTASRRCAEIYEDAPCLKKFEKRGELAYRAICGGVPK